MSDTPELLYVGDPLCSWCWGFAPSLRKVRLDYADRLKFRMMVGGLRTGPAAAPLDAQLRKYLSEAWKEVERRSGQPFDHTFLERGDFVYDTEPACRSVVTARRLDPDRAFDYNEALQDAFYHRGLDPTDEATFLAVAREHGFSEATFQESFRSDAVAAETTHDFELARAMGVHGFPSTLVRDGDTITSITRGWLPPDIFVDQLRPWLEPGGTP